MEQIFNPKRFLKYAVYKVTATQKPTLLILTGTVVALFLFTFMLTATNGLKNDNQWMGLFFGALTISGLLLIGHAFPELRRKKTSINFLTAPVSTFEKFTFEVLFKIVVFTLLFPLVFKLIGVVTVELADFIWPSKYHHACTFNGLKKFSKEEFFPIIPWLYILGASLAFAGASAFKKLPLIKSIIIIALAIGSVAGYFYLMMEKMHLSNGIQHFLFEVLKMDKHEPPLSAFIVFVAGSALVALVYAFYNLKEREE